MSRSSEHADTTPISNDELTRLFGTGIPAAAVVLAVSGGADSMAMMHLFARFLTVQPQNQNEPRLDRNSVTVVSIDHGLRAAAHNECEFVAQAARKLGFNHATLKWEGDKPQSGLQAAARAARLRLLKAFTKQLGVSPVIVMMAHNKNDQAETVLMRLARGSGADGLQAMQRITPLAADKKAMLFRPLLNVARSRLEATLRRAGLSWTEDPSNRDTDFERVRLRNMRRARDALNLSDDALVRTARRMQKTQSAIRYYVQQAMAEHVTWNRGAIAQISREAICDPPEHITLEVVANVLSAMNAQRQPISLAKLEGLTTRLRHDLEHGRKPRTATLAGCLIEFVQDWPLNDSVPDNETPVHTTSKWDGLLIYREPGRLPLTPVPIRPGQTITWAGSLECTLPEAARTELDVRALGPEQFARLHDEGVISAPPQFKRAAPTLPSLWRKTLLLSVPHLDYVDPSWPEPAATLGAWPHRQKIDS